MRFKRKEKKTAIWTELTPRLLERKPLYGKEAKKKICLRAEPEFKEVRHLK